MKLCSMYIRPPPGVWGESELARLHASTATHMYAYQVEDVDEGVRQDADDLARHDRYCAAIWRRRERPRSATLLPRNTQETHRLQ